MDVFTKFESYSLPEKEKFFQGLKPFLKSSANFAAPFVDSLDKYESLSKTDQENFFEVINKVNLASLLLDVPSEENSKLKQKTLDYWVISKNSPKKRASEKECNKSVFENEDENKSKGKKSATDSKDDTKRNTLGKQHCRNRPSTVISETAGETECSSDKFDASEKSSEQAASLITSITLDKVSSDQQRILKQTTNESEFESNKKGKVSSDQQRIPKQTANESQFESNKKGKTSNLNATVRYKSDKNSKHLPKCNKLEPAKVRDDSVHKKLVEVKDIIENEQCNASDSPRQLGKRRYRSKKIESTLEDILPQKASQSPDIKSNDEVENTVHCTRKTRNRNKKRNDEVVVSSINLEKEKPYPLKKSSMSKSLEYLNEAESLTTSTHTKSPKVIEQAKHTVGVRDDRNSKTSLKRTKLSLECEKTKCLTESSSAKESEVIHEDSVKTHMEYATNEISLNLYANETNESENVMPININDKTATSIDSVSTARKSPKIKSRKRKNISKMTSKQGNFFPECESATESDVKEAKITAEDSPEVHEKTFKTEMSPKGASNVYSNKTKDTETAPIIVRVTVTNNSPKAKCKSDKKASKNQFKGSTFSPECDKSTSPTKSCSSKESKIIIENDVELCTDDIHFEPGIKTPLCVNTNMIKEQNVKASNKNNNSVSPKRSVRVTNKSSKLKSTLSPAKQSENLSKSSQQGKEPSPKHQNNSQQKVIVKDAIENDKILSPSKQSKMSPKLEKLSKLSQHGKKPSPKHQNNSQQKVTVKDVIENDKILSPSKQSKVSPKLEKLSKLSQHGKEPLTKHQNNSQQKVTVKDAVENDKILSPSKQSKMSPKSKLSHYYNELNDDIDNCVKKAKNSSKSKLQKDSSVAEIAADVKSTLLHCNKDKKEQSPKNKSEEIDDDYEIKQADQLFKKAGKRNRKQVDNAAVIDSIMETFNEAELSFSEPTSHVELQDVKNSKISPFSIRLGKDEMSKAINFNSEAGKSEIDPVLVQSKSRLTRSKVNTGKTLIEVSSPSVDIVYHKNLKMNQNNHVDNFPSSENCSQSKNQKLNTTQKNEEIVHSDQLTNFVPEKGVCSKVSPKLNKLEGTKVSWRTKRNLSNETDNKVSSTAKKVKFSENASSNVLGSDAEELPKVQSDSQSKHKLHFTRRSKGQNSDSKKYGASSEINKSPKVNKTKPAIVLSAEETGNGKETTIRNESENIKLDRVQSENTMAQSSKEICNVVNANTSLKPSKPLLTKRKRHDTNKIKNDTSKNKRRRLSSQIQLEEEFIDSTYEEKTKGSNVLECSSTHDKVQPSFTPAMLKKYKEYNKLREACATMGIDVDELFECQEIKDMVSNSDIFTKEAIVFIGPYKMPETEKVVPIVYVHASKNELCRTLDKMNVKNMKNTPTS